MGKAWNTHYMNDIRWMQGGRGKGEVHIQVDLIIERSDTRQDVHLASMSCDKCSQAFPVFHCYSGVLLNSHH